MEDPPKPQPPHRKNYQEIKGSSNNGNIEGGAQKEVGSLQPKYSYYAMVSKQKGHFSKLLFEHLHETLVYCMVFWSFGMCIGFLGPTLWDLGCKTGTILPTMSWVFFSQSLFILIGSVISGILIEKFTAHPVLLTGMIGICSTLAAIPFCVSMTSLALTLALMGLSMGLIDTTANVLMIRLYTIDVSPFLQALHFCYGLGAFLSPMIAEPFLENFDCTMLIENKTERSSELTELEKSLMTLDANEPAIEKMNEPKTLSAAQTELQLNSAFWIFTVLQLPVIIAVISLWYKRKSEEEPPQKIYQDLEVKKSQDTSPVHTISCGNCCVFSGSNIFVGVILLAGFLLFLADGMQAAFGGFVFSYGRISAGIKSKEAALLNASFWGMFAAGRGLGILLALFMSPGLMLIIDIFGASGSMVMMLVFPSSAKLLYLGTLTFGFFLSSIYPSTISLAEQFVEIGPSSTSTLVVCAAIGEMVFPVAVGHLVDQFGPNIFIVVGNVALILMILVFFTFSITGLHAKKDPSVYNLIKVIFPCCFREPDGVDDKDIAINDSPPYGRLNEEPSDSYGGLQ